MIEMLNKWIAIIELESMPPGMRTDDYHDIVTYAHNDFINNYFTLSSDDRVKLREIIGEWRIIETSYNINSELLCNTNMIMN